MSIAAGAKGRGNDPLNSLVFEASPHSYAMVHIPVQVSPLGTNREGSNDHTSSTSEQVDR
jgi:hypothetical protein